MKFLGNQSRLAEAGLFFVTIIWGSAFVVVKNATDTIPPGFIIAFRFSIAFICLCLFFFRRLNKITFFYIKWGLLIGLLNFVGFEFQTMGVKYTTAGKNAFLTAVYCVIVPFLYWFIKHKKPDIYNIVSALICIVGIGFLSLREGFAINLGDLLSLLCGITFALQIVTVGILTEKNDPILLCITQSAGTLLFAFPVAFATEKWPAALPFSSVLCLFYLGVFSTMIAFVLQLVCQKYTAPAKASLIMSLESVFGTLSGIVFLGESVSIKTFVGFVLVFLAILLSETKPPLRRKQRDRKIIKNHQ